MSLMLCHMEQKFSLVCKYWSYYVSKWIVIVGLIRGFFLFVGFLWVFLLNQDDDSENTNLKASKREFRNECLQSTCL